MTVIPTERSERRDLQVLLAFECPQNILMNRSRSPVHEAMGGHAVRTFTACNISGSDNADMHKNDNTCIKI